MTPEAILTVSAAVVSLTQLLKWGNLVPDRWGPLAVLVLSLVGVSFWIWTSGPFLRADGFSYFSAWVTVSLSASGVYGFTRASASAVIRAMPPPAGGAGSEPTVPTPDQEPT